VVAVAYGMSLQGAVHPRCCLQDGIFSRMVKSCLSLADLWHYWVKGTLARVLLVKWSFFGHSLGWPCDLGVLVGLGVCLLL
jgi:hypothetical protein